MADDAGFACARDGLAGTLGGLLGGHDGARAWFLRAGGLRGGDEQVMAEWHEGLHDELQMSSAWGMLASTAFLLWRRKYRPLTLRQVFELMVGKSQETHERFATTLSADRHGVRATRALLAGNPDYLGYLDRGLGLVDGRDIPWLLRRAATEAVLRSCMSPAHVSDLLAKGFENLTHDDLDLSRQAPDQRLKDYERTGGPSSWGPLFRELIAEFSSRGGDLGNADRAAPLDSQIEWERLTRFENEVLLPRCHGHAAAVLAAAGLTTVGWADVEEFALALRTAMHRVDPDLAKRFNPVMERRPIQDDGEYYDRQRILLHDDRFPAEVIGDISAVRDAYEISDADGPRYVCAAWMSRDVAAAQFAIPVGRELPDHVAVLAIAEPVSSGAPAARIGLVAPACSPRQMQEQLGDAALVALTTSRTLADPRIERVLRQVEPVYVLMDLPITKNIDAWVREGARVRYALDSTPGISTADLWTAVFVIDRAPSFRLFTVNGKMQISLLVAYLQRHGESMTLDHSVILDDLIPLHIAVGHVLATWHVLGMDTSRALAESRGA